MRRSGKTVLFVAAGLSWNLAMASSGFAQAWLPPKGEATFSLVYQNIFMKDHLFSQGERLDRGQMYYQNVVADLSYSVTDRLSLRASLPYVLGKYTGSQPHLLPIDDGTYHGTFQDFRFEARYNAVRGPIVLTPFVGAVLPTHRYEHYAHSAPGSALRQILVGTGFGRRLDPFLPDGYFQGRYSYTFVERLENVVHNTNNRSNMTLEIGYFVKPSISVFAMGMGQITHGGIEFVSSKPFATVEDLHNHDQISRANSLEIGGGVGYAVNPWLDVFGTWLTTVAGRNGHAMNRGLSFGMTMSFSPRQILRKSSRGAAPAATPGS